MQNVQGTPDFLSVMLKWERQRDSVSEDAEEEEPSFTVRFCENQVRQALESAYPVQIRR